MHANITEKIQKYLCEIVKNISDIREIWLIGSRANETAQDNSDWDFLVFGTESTLKELKCQVIYEIDNIDLLVVYDGDNFQTPWEEQPKSGSLSEWCWDRTSENIAKYKQIKFIPDDIEQDCSDLELGEFQENTVNAIKIK
jgi:predicted nucleotidyltransferase